MARVGGIILVLTVLLYVAIPKGHPAMGLVTLNLTANMLGLGNAATPFGIKAMEELQKLNKTTDTATNEGPEATRTNNLERDAPNAPDITGAAAAYPPLFSGFP